MCDQSLVQDSLSYTCVATVLDMLFSVQELEDGSQSMALDVGVLETPPHNLL